MRPRVLLVPGGVRGIGRAVALRCAREGWRVAACHRRSHDDAASLAQASPDVDVAVCDLTDADARVRWVADVTARLGDVDALVHAAGPFSRAPLEAQTDAHWREAWESNVIPYVALARMLTPGMAARGFGRVVAFGAAGAEALAPPPAVSAYMAAKAAVLAHTRALAVALAPHGVTANVVAPGVVDTGGVDADLTARLARRVPAGRAGRAEEAAAVVGFLLSEEAGYVTGACVDVAGGFRVG